jgi:hypothetical protein
METTMQSNTTSHSGALRFIALAELLLIFPAVLFLGSLFARDVQPPGLEPAQTARRVVDWYAARPVLGLDVFLIALPFVAFIIGCATALRRWTIDAGLRGAALETLAAVRAHFATLLIAGATLAAGGILGIVALHVITD